MEYEYTPEYAILLPNEQSLNPCSNGIQKYAKPLVKPSLLRGLNPCSNGIQKYALESMNFSSNDVS